MALSTREAFVLTVTIFLLVMAYSRLQIATRSVIEWRLSSSCKELAKQQRFTLAPDDAPRVAILLYRKHVITNQRYIQDLIRTFESEGFIPVP